MTKIIVAILLILILCILCGCVPPLGEQSITLNNGAVAGEQESNGDDGDSNEKFPSRTIYVSGAVVNDGYVEIPAICDYKALLDIVGICEFSSLPNNINTFPDSTLEELYLNFICEGVVCYSINVNSVIITSGLEIPGVSQNVVNALADYIMLNGKITNRNQLKIALGKYYDDNYYKFYIDRADYA